MKFTLFTSILLIVLSACTPMPGKRDAMERVNQEFIGQDANNFFLSYGRAAGSASMRDGGRQYRWLSVEPNGGGRSGYLVSPSGHYVTPSDETNGEMLSGYCEISVRTDASDRIKKIAIVSDSVGKFSGSRCAEIFGQK